MAVDELGSRQSGTKPKLRIPFSSQEKGISRIDLPSMDLFILS